jgi:hypothetical protein
VALPIAREGIRVVGIDSSPEMLERLEEKARGEPDLPLSWREADMRTFDLRDEGPFALVYVPARAFLHVMDVEGQLAVLERVREHLAEGGVFAGNCFFPNVEIIAAGWRGTGGWKLGDGYVDPDTGNRVVVYHMNAHDPRTQAIRALFRCEHLDASGEVVRTEIREHELTWLWPRELEHLLARAGFALEALHGDYDGTPFPEKSNEMLWVARRTGNRGRV